MITLSKPLTLATTLKCSNCGQLYSLSSVNTFAQCCNQPLVVEYDESIGFSKDSLRGRQNNMWRYSEMLPVEDERNIISLGEGMTPVFSLKKLAGKIGLTDLLLKDESFNPT